ncbi:MAG: sulfatase-like hydrolase/transferase [Bacteroidota bacterium]|nr:sulfatase-like hydrolase/transferase [Bacteroidota bacterium]
MNKLLPISVGIMLFSFQNHEKKTEASRVSEIAKPNILFLFADDQRADALGCSGNPYIKTPNIDNIAKVGVRFANSYVMGGHHGAICAPSRAMLMSGKSLFHVYDKLEGVHTMPMHFAENGYETFGTGKWHNGANTFEASFQKGDNVFIGGMCDHFNVPCRTLVNGKLSEPVKKGFSTDLFAEAATGFLNSYAKGKRENPFFCYVAYTAPHDPRSPREDYIGMYGDESIPLPGNFKKYHPFAFDDMIIRDENLAPWPRTPEIIQASLADYYALISHIDKSVGDLIGTLKKEGLYENTIIVYAADNGLAIGSHGLLGKQNLYEHSMKVPLIISGPGIPKDKVSDALVYLYDLFPTMTDLCGLPAPDQIDGKDIAPVIRGESEGVRSSLFTAYRNTVRAVRTNEWKMIRYPERDYTQLFNLKNDPLELNNLANQPESQSRVDEMMKLLVDWQRETNDTVSLTANKIQPMEYDPESFKQKPDIHQPAYVLKRYFKGEHSGERVAH